MRTCHLGHSHPQHPHTPPRPSSSKSDSGGSTCLSSGHSSNVSRSCVQWKQLRRGALPGASPGCTRMQLTAVTPAWRIMLVAVGSSRALRSVAMRSSVEPCVRPSALKERGGWRGGGEEETLLLQGQGGTLEWFQEFFCGALLRVRPLALQEGTKERGIRRRRRGKRKGV